MTAKQTTETGRTMVPEGHYDMVTVEYVEKKEIKEFIIYEWSFSTIKDGEPFEFKISLFSSQMADLLRALGATEVSRNKFEWDDMEVLGLHVAFNVIHVADKKGVLREQLSDVVNIATPRAEIKKNKKDEEATW